MAFRRAVQDTDGPLVLLVEPDHEQRSQLAKALRDEDFRVITASDGRSAVGAHDADVAAVVLAVQLPDVDSRDVCRRLRRRDAAVPLIFTGRDERTPVLLSCYAAGADDFLRNGFEPAELIARIRALLRRSERTITRGTGELYLDPQRQVLRCGVARVRLTPLEFRLMTTLVNNPDVEVSRMHFRNAGWPPGRMVRPNTIDQYVSRLRRKLAQCGSGRSLRRTALGGFRLDGPAVQQPGRLIVRA